MLAADWSLYDLLALGLGDPLGSIPFGLILTKLAGHGDVRAIGSGNIGATNVLRTGRRDLALATLVLDAGKAGAALLLARALWGDQYGWAGIDFVAGGAAFLGHCFPVWLKFKGGKGVATFFGVLFAGVWPLGLVAGMTWLAVAAITRTRRSPRSRRRRHAHPRHRGRLRRAGDRFHVDVAVLIFFRHRANIRRLLNGTEPRIGGDKTAGVSQSDAAVAESGASSPPAPPPNSASAVAVSVDVSVRRTATRQGRSRRQRRRRMTRRFRARSASPGCGWRHAPHRADYVSRTDGALPRRERRTRGAAALRARAAADAARCGTGRGRDRGDRPFRCATDRELRAGLSAIVASARRAAPRARHSWRRRACSAARPWPLSAHARCPAQG